MLVTANEVPAKSELDKPSTGQSYHRPSARAGDRCVEFDAAPRDSSSNFCRRLERVVLKCAFCAPRSIAGAGSVVEPRSTADSLDRRLPAGSTTISG